MKLKLIRDIKAPKFTLGKLYVGNEFGYYTCEDAVREIEGSPVKDWKIAGDTAIPKGTYRVIINFSNRFQKFLPQLLDVPGFTGIRIHAGTTYHDTEGCILLGAQRIQGGVGNSRLAMSDFMPKLEAGIAAGVVTIEVADAVG